MVRFGFVSAANVGRKSWAAISRSGHTVSVVASRDVAKAEVFIAECQAIWPQEVPARAVGSYEEVCSAPDVDVVYVPLPTALRAEWVVTAARNKKQVLCEKPCAVSVDRLREMVGSCEAAGVQFVDACAFSHGKRIAAIQAALPQIGEIRRVQANVCMIANDAFMANNIRVKKELEPLGALGDLGVYCVRAILHVLGNGAKLPSRASGRILRSTDDGVPLEFSGELLFDAENVSASIFCSFFLDWHADLTIYGTNGRITMRDFFSPLYGDTTAFTCGRITNTYVDRRRRATKVDAETVVDEDSTFQETALIEAIASCVAGRREPTWPAMSLATQALLDAMMVSATAHNSAAVPVPSVSSLL